MDKPSIFSRIIRGELPCHKIYEDEDTLAFLDIHPITPGQALVVPKKQVAFVWDLDSREYHALMETVHKVAQKLREIYPDKDRVGIMIEGLDVADHAHVKVFAFDDGEYRSVPDMNSEPDHTTLARIAEELRF